MTEHSEFRWLHISDLHLESTVPDGYRSNDALEKLVAAMIESQFKPDMIFFTGDLALKGGEYASTFKFFDDLLEATCLTQKLKERAKERLFIIPGNHDIDRDKCKSVRIPQSNDEVELLAKFYFKRLHRFIGFFNHYFKGIRSFTYKEPYISELIPISFGQDLIRFGVIGLNSTCFCQDNSDEHNLWIHFPFCENAFKKMKEKCIADGDDRNLVFVLQHHPLSWINKGERDKLKSYITNNADILLTGHIHENDPKEEKDKFGELISFQAGAMEKRGGYSAICGSIDLKRNIVSANGIFFSNTHKKWLPDTECANLKFNLKNEIPFIKDTRTIPFVVAAMTKQEALELDSGTIFKKSFSSERDRLNYDKLRPAIQEIFSTIINNYFDRRLDWRPHIDSSISISEQVQKMLEFMNKEPLYYNYCNIILENLTDSFFDESSADNQEDAWKRLRQNGGIIIIDSISLFHPKILEVLLKSTTLLCGKVSAIVLAPINQNDIPPNNCILKLVKRRIPSLLVDESKFLENYCEVGVSDIRNMKRWLYLALPRSLDVRKKYVEESHRKDMEVELGKPVGFNNLWR